eukprot:GHRR01031044.1.p1 GENE.GHRR01031044.1~~GHRR01031044.1.p1  ORF type:complete len:188 (+),score=59.67 GHRR01031044.1:256-819(+)
MASTLKFCPLQSCVDVSFWAELSNRKLEQYQLSETPVDILGWLTASRHEEIGSLVHVLGSSFAAESGAAVGQQGSHAAPGKLLLTNTLEAFKHVDKPSALQTVGQQVWADVQSGAAEQRPECLSRFLLLAYGDLKQFIFHYWFAFPVLKPPSPFQQLSATPLTAHVEAQHLHGPQELAIAGGSCCRY